MAEAPEPAVSAYAAVFPSVNPLDGIRITIADEVARIAGVGKALAFDCLDRTATLDTGDLLLAVPRLRVTGLLPKKLASKIASEVMLMNTIYALSPCPSLIADLV